MKSILLTTTAIVAFAGAAAADGHAGVTFGGDASLGFNDNAEFGEDGFYWEGDLNVTGTAALDNGVTASLALEFDLFDETNGQAVSSDGVLLSLESDGASLYLGDTAFAAETQWQSAGDMESDGFSEADGENVIRGDVTVGGFDASVSYNITHALGGFVNDTYTVPTGPFTDYDTDGDGVVDAGSGAALLAAAGTLTTNDEVVDQLSIGVSGDVGMFSMSVAYQEESVSAGIAAAAAGANSDDIDALVEAGLYAPGVANGDFNEAEIWGISGGVSVSGADITLAYASNETADTTSTGIQVAYPFGPVTATVYYVAEEGGANEDPNYGINVAYSDGPIAATFDYDDDQGTQKWNLDGSYDTGLGLTVLAGMQNENEGDDADYYVGGSYDLGGGATFLTVFAEDDDGDQEDEIGGGDYMPGTTVEVSFSF